jgi:uncharacterized membrane protein
MQRSADRSQDTSLVRVLVAVTVGVIVATASFGSRWQELVHSPGCYLSGWLAGVVIYLAWTWLVLWRMNGQQTLSYAKVGDLKRFVAHFIMMLTSIASVAGVGFLLHAGSRQGRESLAAALLGVASVAAAWFVVHTVFTLHYAALYYAAPSRPIDFNDTQMPAYADFAYLAFTIGMAYAVSDNNLKTRAIRKKVLLHAMISYVLGAVIIAVTINLLAGLGSRT